MKTLQLSLACRTLPIILNGADGTAHSFELREMTAATRDQYLQKLDGRVTKDRDGKAVGMSRLEGMQSDLLTCCLFADGAKDPVPSEEIQKWPATVVTQLFEAARDLNRLVVEQDAARKND